MADAQDDGATGETKGYQNVSERPYAVGMIGLGTVGSGVLELLGRQSENLERRLLRPVDVRRVAVRDLTRSRPTLASYDSGSLASCLRRRVNCRPL